MNIDTKAILDRMKPKQLKVVTPDVQLCTARFSPDGQTLAAGSFIGTVRRWSTADDAFAEVDAITGHNGFVQCVLYRADGRLFTADSWGQIRATPGWSNEKAHSAWVRKLALSPDGRTLASGSLDHTIRLWNSDDGKPIRSLDAGDDVLSLLFSPDGQSLLSGDLHGVIKQWDIATGKVIRELDAKVMYRYDRIQDVGGVRCLMFAPDGQTLFAAGCEPASGGFVEGEPVLMTFDWVKGQATQTLKLGAKNEGFIHDLAWHPEGFLMLATSGQPGVGKLHFLAPGDDKPFFTTAMANCHAVALHPNGKRVVVSATNANSSGNGRVKGKTEQDYPGNVSPLHVWSLG